MAKVESVLGKIDTSIFGKTLIHEHLVATDWNQRICMPGWVDEEKVAQKVAADLIFLKETYGVMTIGDMTPWSLGRDVVLLKKISQLSGVNILCVTGFYADDQPYFRGASLSTLVDVLLRDIYEGIQKTNIKPSAIKCATDKKGVDAQNQTLLKAAAIAHKESKLPIFTHTDASIRCATSQQQLFEEEGVDLNKVVIGHCGDSNDLTYIESILKRGSYVGLDRFGQDKYNSLDNRIETMLRLLERGWIKQIVISHDHLDYCTNDTLEKKELNPKTQNGITLGYIEETVLPRLRGAGVSDEEINTILVTNPKSIFKK